LGHVTGHVTAGRAAGAKHNRG